MRQINGKDLASVSISAVRLDGTVNCTLYLMDGTDLELYGLSPGQAYRIEGFIGSDRSISFDERLTEYSIRLFDRQNGIN